MRPFLALVLLPMLALTACGGGSASPVGTWQIDSAALDKSLGAMIEKMPANEREQAKANMDKMKGFFSSMGFELKADGTATMTMTMGNQKHDETGTWKQTGDQVVVTAKDNAKDTKTMTLANGKLSWKEKKDDGTELDMVFEKKK